jgi:hypothetical protein
MGGPYNVIVDRLQERLPYDRPVLNRARLYIRRQEKRRCKAKLADDLRTVGAREQLVGSLWYETYNGLCVRHPARPFRRFAAFLLRAVRNR